jgi:hypothetical protein
MVVKNHWTSIKKVQAMTLMVTAILGITACKQILSVDVVRYADKSSYMVSKQALRDLDRVFYSNFSLGTWYYKGAKARTGEVEAYIQIPEQLDMPKAVQTSYVQQVICPKAEHTQLWFQLKNVELTVHLYTKSKQQSISARCLNPLRHS